MLFFLRKTLMHVDSVLGKCEILIQENTLIRENIKQRMILLKTLHFLNFMLSGSCWSIFSAMCSVFLLLFVFVLFGHCIVCPLIYGFDYPFHVFNKLF